jgi:hypothetical protein
MASKFKFELDRAGVKELMQGSEMQSIINGAGRAVQSAAGDGYSLTTGVGRTRAQALVYADTPKARALNRKNQTLQKALGSVRV